MPRNIRQLVAKIDQCCRAALEGAAGVCVNRGHYEVDVEHFLTQLVDIDGSDLHAILRHFDLPAERVRAELTRALDRFKTGNTRTPVIGPRLPALIEKSWLVASVDFGADRLRSGHMLITALEDPDLQRLLEDSSPTLAHLPADALRKDFLTIAAGSSEDEESRNRLGGPGPAAGGRAATDPALDQYTADLTANAREGRIDPVIGRDAEIRLVIDILSRRRQNNPILTGEPGVGKTAVVEGLALRIAVDDVPPPLKGVRLLSLDLGLLQAGASVRGEFESRLRAIIDAVAKSPTPIILFIDEAHQLIGAGGQAGQGDAANLLKPALARGQLRTIAATTWSEYKKYFERDAALARRFQVVKVEEPSEATAIAMVRAVAEKMSWFHRVRIVDDAVVQAVGLSHRYLSGRQLPDKAVSLLDTACARVAIGLHAVPAPIEDLRRRIEAVDREEQALRRDRLAQDDERLAALADERRSADEDLAGLQERWSQEQAVCRQILDVYDRVDPWDAPDGAETAASAATDEDAALLRRLTGELKDLQGESGLVDVLVTGQTVASVLAAWTGIPVGKMLRDEIASVRSLDRQLAERVIGQDHALALIAKRIKTARARLGDPSRPIGVFLLAGPSGVGKTETALALADALYGGERNSVTINMSEFQESHTVSSLKGAPPGYVGYGEGGVLTEAVRRRPYCVVLLDEVEKAHPDVLELFFQVFDKGVLDDGEGRTIDFKNTMILLTSNAASQTITELCSDPANLPTPEAINQAIWPELEQVFKPAFLGRLTVIPYYPVQDAVLRRIIELKLGKIRSRFQANHGAELAYGEDVVAAIAARCNQVGSGARLIDNILTSTLLPQISDEILAGMAENRKLRKVEIKAAADGEFTYALTGD